MAFSNSSLVTHTKLSSKYNPRNGNIEGITIHHNAGVATVPALLNYAYNTDRSMSFNYCINDSDVGLCVEEKNRAWTSSNRDNDHRCVTIEVCNSSTGGDWPISDKSMETLIKLCADICKRNDIKKLYFDGTTKGTLTRHEMFAATNCPGPYIKNHTQYICDEVNKLINGNEQTPEPPVVEEKKYEVVVPLKGYYTAADAVAGKNAKRTVEVGTYYVYNETSEAVNVTKTAGVPGAWINKSLNKKEETKPVEPSKPDTSNPIGKDVIVNGRLYGTSAGANPGKTVSNLKTKVTRYQKGAKYPYNFTGDIGWASESSVKFIDFTPTPEPEPKPTTGFKVGDKVKVNKNAKSYEGKSVASFVYSNTYTIDELNGNRAVLDKKGICTAFNTKDLTKVSSSTTPFPKPPVDNTIKVGSKVKVKKGAKSYEGKKIASFVYNNVYTVDQLSGKRAVLDEDGLCTAFNTDDLIKQ